MPLPCCRAIVLGPGITLLSVENHPSGHPHHLHDGCLADTGTEESRDADLSFFLRSHAFSNC